MSGLVLTALPESSKYVFHHRVALLAEADIILPSGEGRVHQCLRDNFQKLTDGCRKEELKLNIIQSRDVRLRPKLNKACSEEIAVYCKDVEKGTLLPPCSPVSCGSPEEGTAL